MRATLNIPDDLLSEVQKATGEKSKTKAIVTAMEGFVRGKKIRALLSLRGKIDIDYDWQKEEALELKAQEERLKLLEQQ
jgi:hypothetical protein